jgi:hypothetical protein
MRTFPDSTSLHSLMRFLASGVACSLTFRPCSIRVLSDQENKIHEAIFIKQAVPKQKDFLSNKLRKEQRIEQRAAEVDKNFVGVYFESV